MYLDDISLFTKNNFKKRTVNLSITSEDIQSVSISISESVNLYEICHRKICHVNNDKQKTTNDGKNRTTRSRKIRTLEEIAQSAGTIE